MIYLFSILEVFEEIVKRCDLKKTYINYYICKERKHFPVNQLLM